MNRRRFLQLVLSIPALFVKLPIPEKVKPWIHHALAWNPEATTEFVDGDKITFDGANDYIDIYPTSLPVYFSKCEGTIMMWCKVHNKALTVEEIAERFEYYQLVKEV